MALGGVDMARTGLRVGGVDVIRRREICTRRVLSAS